MRTERRAHWLAVAVLAIPALQVLLFLVSWLINAASPESVVRSLLGSEGIRWFFGSFVDNVASPPLVWILVGAVAYGAVRESGVIEAIRRSPAQRTYRQTFALRMVLVQMIVFLAVWAVMAFLPHAPLLSATGSLFPSSFSRSLIPSLAFCVGVGAVVYAVLAGGKQAPADILAVLTSGIRKAAPLILIYVMLSELVCSVAYVFRLSLP